MLAPRPKRRAHAPAWAREEERLTMHANAGALARENRAGAYIQKKPSGRTRTAFAFSDNMTCYFNSSIFLEATKSPASILYR